MKSKNLKEYGYRFVLLINKKIENEYKINESINTKNFRNLIYKKDWDSLINEDYEKYNKEYYKERTK